MFEVMRKAALSCAIVAGLRLVPNSESKAPSNLAVGSMFLYGTFHSEFEFYNTTKHRSSQRIESKLQRNSLLTVKK
jgi:hypothetical protein